MNVCAFSGKVIDHPVISRLTGDVFDKSIIMEHIKKTGQCPLTGREMKPDDIVEVTVSDKILPSANISMSVPNVLDSVRTEWESLIFGNLEMKKQIRHINEELMNVMSKQEAANVIISRLIAERAEAVDKLNSYKEEFGNLAREEQERNEGEEFDFMGIYEDLENRMKTLAKELTQRRKKREIPASLRSADVIKTFQVVGSFPVHSSSKPGITSLDIRHNLILTGGVDGKAVIFDTDSEKTRFTAGTHNKRITDVQFYPDADILGFLVTSEDSSASFWMKEGDELDFKLRLRIESHKAAVTDSSFHPLKEYCLLSSKDKYWSFNNLIKGVCLTKDQSEEEINKCEIHPDGIKVINYRTDIRMWG